MTNRKRNILYLIPAGLLLFSDRLTKQLAAAHLKGQPPFVIIDKVFEFSYLENTGAAFSSFSGRQTFLILLTSLVILAVIWKFITLPGERRFAGMRLCLLLIGSGAIGNLADRVANRYVVDFIYFVPINFPKFNVADIYITIGIALLTLLLFFYYSDEEFEVLFSLRPRTEQKEC